MLKVLRSAALAALMVCMNAMASGAPAPDVLVKSVTEEVIEVVRTDDLIRSGDNARILQLVEEKVLPHFDFRVMTSLAVGRDWRQATPEQRDKLVSAFRTLLVRTYSNALTQYRDQVIDFKPLRADAKDTDVTVRTQVRQPGAKPVDIDYALEKQGEQWKVYDVVVAGVSLVTNYRSSFAAEVRSGGVDGLIHSLESRNAELAATTK